jgi:oligopeptide transport system substrate-binding protein
MAATPPETDLVRAVFEGLTELNAATLEAVPAAAESWTSSEGFRTWTFTIRADARWSNGRPVTSEDFVRSWKRLGDLGDKIAHPDLLTNIVGFPFKKKPAEAPATELLPTPGEQLSTPAPPPGVSEESAANTNASTAQRGPAPAEIGVSAVDPQTLRVQLLTGDKDFPKLIANPMFRPVAGEGPTTIGTDVVTNGAFRITAADPAGVTLDRSETYWNRDAVKLERVKLVAADSAEKALAAYRAGDIDAVTNANFEPLALKLLEPFDDFRRRPHAAINFYEINHEKPPFDVSPKARWKVRRRLRFHSCRSHVIRSQRSSRTRSGREICWMRRASRAVRIFLSLSSL